jgi:hypothetical protein
MLLDFEGERETEFRTKYTTQTKASVKYSNVNDKCNTNEIWQAQSFRSAGSNITGNTVISIFEASITRFGRN